MGVKLIVKKRRTEAEQRKSCKSSQPRPRFRPTGALREQYLVFIETVPSCVDDANQSGRSLSTRAMGLHILELAYFGQTGTRSAFDFTGKKCVQGVGQVDHGLIFLIAFIEPVERTR